MGAVVLCGVLVLGLTRFRYLNHLPYKYIMHLVVILIPYKGWKYHAHIER